jgi:ribosomal protein S6--L-glutamate ligase
MKQLHLLVLANTNQPHLIQAIKRRNHTYELHSANNLYLFVSQSENGYDRLYNGHADLVKPERIKAKDIDAVVSRIGSGLNHGASILRHLNENLNIYCPQTADGLLTAADKLKTTQKLSFNGLRCPSTVYAKSPLHIDFLLSKVGGLPAVAKLLHGSQGVGVSILETPLATNTALESYWKSDIDIKIQSFIDAGGKDIRAIVVGDKVVSSMERTANKGDFRANISKSGTGRKIELSNEDKDICVRASKAVGLQFSGVDIMKDKDGKTYVIEINGNPGSKIIDITGHNHFEDLLDFIENKVNKNQTLDTEKKALELKIENSAPVKKISIVTQMGMAIEAERKIENASPVNRKISQVTQMAMAIEAERKAREAMYK